LSTSRNLDIQGVLRFHGHTCPGVAIGIRAAEAAMAQLGPRADDEELVCVAEADFCAVDAIQYLMGCTFGKGNLIHRDWGKKAFTFFRRSDGTALRVAWRTGFGAENAGDRDAQTEAILQAPLEALFTIEAMDTPLPERAKVMGSVVCSACGEEVMASKVQWESDTAYCIPCHGSPSPEGPG